VFAVSKKAATFATQVKMSAPHEFCQERKLATVLGWCGSLGLLFCFKSKPYKAKRGAYL